MNRDSPGAPPEQACPPGPYTCTELPLETGPVSRRHQASRTKMLKRGTLRMVHNVSN